MVPFSVRDLRSSGYRLPSLNWRAGAIHPVPHLIGSDYIVPLGRLHRKVCTLYSVPRLPLHVGKAALERRMGSVLLKLDRVERDQRQSGISATGGERQVAEAKAN
jgi:hypothetical protein